jgi:hypothetical protein
VLLRPTDEGDDVVCITQPAHAWISGQLARAWGEPVEPRDEVCLAAEQHDLGMAVWDAAPELNRETGRPYSFMEMPLDVHLGLWRRAPELVLVQDRYAALLVSMHGCALYEMRDLERMAADDAAKVRAYLAHQRQFQDELRASLGVSEQEARRNQRLLWAWDFLSLAVCLDWAPAGVDRIPLTGGEQRLSLTPAGDGRLTVDPWPFRERTVDLRCDARVLEGRFEDEGAMHAALQAAPWVPAQWRLVTAS